MRQALRGVAFDTAVLFDNCFESIWVHVYHNSFVGYIVVLTVSFHRFMITEHSPVFFATAISCV